MPGAMTDHGHNRAISAVVIRIPGDSRSNMPLALRIDARQPPAVASPMACSASTGIRQESSQDRADPDTESCARRDAEPGHQAERRARQTGGEQARQIQHPGHPGGERDVLGVIEHRPVVDGAEHEKHDGQQAGAWTGQEPRQTPSGDNTENTERGAQQVTRFEIRKRREWRDDRRHQVEQTAVEVEIRIAECPGIRQPRQIEVEEEPAVGVLDLFIGGDAVVAKRECDYENENDEDCQREAVEEPIARNPPPRERDVRRRPAAFRFR